MDSVASLRTQDTVPRIWYNTLISCSQATGGPDARCTRREEWSGARGEGVWAKFPGTSRKFKLGAAKGKPQTQTPQTPRRRQRTRNQGTIEGMDDGPSAWRMSEHRTGSREAVNVLFNAVAPNWANRKRHYQLNLES
jgi:hypothetical protein